MPIPDDPLGAFCRENHAALGPTGRGLLDDLSFAAKDVFDVAGRRTGFGNPRWLATHPPAERTAAAVERLLAGGARMVGRTLTDELTYSLTGENVHYGTPANPRCPDRVPGGSSSGSVSAVAGGLCDFAIGTDCAGSVRLPASYCGVLGMRPTHGRVPLDGAPPFAPSFDTAGWLARDGGVLERVGRVLLADDGPAAEPVRLLVARDAFELVDPAVAGALAGAVEAVAGVVGHAEEVTVAPEGLDAWMECFRTIQGAEIWASLGGWIRAAQPELGPGIAERFEWASRVGAEAVEAAKLVRASAVSRLEELLGPGDVLCLPTSPRVAPLRGTATDEVEVTYRYQAISLLCIAGLGGLPQASLPLADLDGCPLGLSLAGARGADLMLLELTRRFT